MTLNTGFVLTVLADRGVPCDSKERMRATLQALDGAQQAELSRAVRAVHSGGDRQEDLDCLYAIARCASPTTEEAVSSAGARYDASKLYAWLATDSLATGTLERIRSGDRSAAAETRDRLGETKANGHHQEHKAPPSKASVMPVKVRKSDVQAQAEDAATAASDTGVLAGKKHYAFAKHNALMFELDMVQGDDSDKRRNTLRVEAAKKLPAKEDGKTRVDWRNKIIFQFTKREMPSVAAAFLGLIPSLRFESHGPRDLPNKWCEIVLQPGKVFVKVARERRVIAVPIEGSDLYQIAILAQRVLLMNDPDIPGACLIEALRLTSAVTARSGTGQGVDDDDR